MKNILKNDTEVERDILRYAGIITIITAVSVWLIVTIMIITGKIDVNQYNLPEVNTCNKNAQIHKFITHASSGKNSIYTDINN